MNRRRALMAKVSSGGRIPDAYQEVEWVAAVRGADDTTGSPINTGKKFTGTGKITFTVTACPTQTLSNNGVLCGCGRSDNSSGMGISFAFAKEANRFWIYNGGAYATCSPNSASPSASTADVINQFYTYTGTLDGSAMSSSVESNSGSNTATVFTYGNEDIFFLSGAYSDDSAKYTASARVKYAKLQEGNTVLFEYVPCYRKSDSVVGFYDLANSEFVTTSGIPLVRGADVGFTASIPTGYVTDGLMFFLDVKQNASASSWTDCASGRVCTLYNCTESASGIVFDGSTSYGEIEGAISNVWESETIETAVSGIYPNGTIVGILNQPNNGGNGVSLVFASSQTNFNTCNNPDGVSRAYFKTPSRSNKTISVNTDRLVTDQTNRTSTGTETYNGWNDGKTTVGARNSTTRAGKFQGTLCAIRVYNRKLTEAEMIQNQQADVARYGLS